MGRITNKALLTAFSALFSAQAVQYAVAQQTLEQQQKALEVISNFAERLCKDLPLEREQQKVELSGDAKAQLAGVLSPYFFLQERKRQNRKTQLQT